MKKPIAIIISLIMIMAITFPAAAFKTIAVKGIKLDKTKITLNVGKTYKLKVTLTPANTTQKSLTFVTGNKKIATVDSTGKIKGVSKGTTTIAVNTSNKKLSARCNVTVLQPDDPLKPVTFTQLVQSNSQIDAITGGDLYKKPFYALVKKKTGVTIKAIPVSPEEFKTKLQLLIATRQTPDIIKTSELKDAYAGGVEKAYQDGVIIKLNDYLKQYAPNFKKIIDSSSEYSRYAKADDGSIYAFGMFRDQETRVFFGPMIREDLLKAASLKVPETIDEWYTALKAFKSAGIKNPFTTISWHPEYSNVFVGAYGAGYKYIIGDDGTYKYGPIEPGFKSFLETWSKWFKEGLIDPDYLTMGDDGKMKSKLISGESAAATGMLSFFGVNVQGKENNKNFRLVAAKPPVLKAGETARYGAGDAPFMISGYISAKCKNIERAVQYFDWGYSEEGHMAFNFGVEGESYNMENGYPKYTELITANPNSKGWTQTQANGMYLNNGLDACYQDKRYFEQIRLQTPEQKEGQPLWAKFKYRTSELPLSFTQSELEARTKLIEIETYVKEMTQKFIIGNEPLSNFDKYVAEVKKMGIDEITKAYNNALKRFNNR